MEIGHISPPKQLKTRHERNEMARTLTQRDKDIEKNARAYIDNQEIENRPPLYQRTRGLIVVQVIR